MPLSNPEGAGGGGGLLSTALKGTTTAGNPTSTDAGLNRQLLDVHLRDGSGNSITSFGGGTQYAEDTPSTNGETGTIVLGVRKDTPTAAALTDTDGDRTLFSADQFGRIYAMAYLAASQSVAATQSGTWNVGITGTPTVSVTGTVTVDTELPAAASITDATANPSVAGVQDFLMGFNGTTWDRVRTGQTAQTTTLTGFPNVLPYCSVLTTAPSLTTGNFALPTLTTTGSLRVQLHNDTDALGGQSTNVDNIAVTTQSTQLPVVNYNLAYNGTSFDRVRSGQTAGAATPTGYLNVIGGALVATSAPSLTNGHTAPLSLTTAGDLRVALSRTDNTYSSPANLNGSTSATPNTWTQVSAVATRNGWYVQNTSDTNIEVGFGASTAEVQTYLLAPGVAAGETAPNGVFQGRIAVRCVTGASKSFVARTW